MGSPCEVLTEAGNAREAGCLAEAAAAEAWRIEDRFSRYLPGNIVDRINTAGGETVPVDAETARLLDFAATLHDLSDGRFDITSGVLRRVWRFDGSDRVPADEDVRAVLENVGWHRVEWSGESIRMPAGMEIDLGGVGKEYAVDRAAAMLRDATPAATLVNFGGDLASARPPQSRRGWQVGVDAIDDRAGRPHKLIELVEGALATSGDARRFVLRDGVRYGHITDPTTGWPVAGAPRSVTVAAATCTQAGMLSTLAMLRGREAESFLDEQCVRYWCLR